jgi:hypothetical protein
MVAAAAAIHQICWAWSTCERRPRETGARLAQSEYAHLEVLGLRRPREIGRALDCLVEAAGVPIRSTGAARHSFASSLSLRNLPAVDLNRPSVKRLTFVTRSPNNNLVTARRTSRCSSEGRYHSIGG